MRVDPSGREWVYITDMGWYEIEDEEENNDNSGGIDKYEWYPGVEYFYVSANNIDYFIDMIECQIKGIIPVKKWSNRLAAFGAFRFPLIAGALAIGGVAADMQIDRQKKLIDTIEEVRINGGNDNGIVIECTWCGYNIWDQSDKSRYIFGISLYE